MSERLGPPESEMQQSTWIDEVIVTEPNLSATQKQQLRERFTDGTPPDGSRRIDIVEALAPHEVDFTPEEKLLIGDIINAVNQDRVVAGLPERPLSVESVRQYEPEMWRRLNPTWDGLYDEKTHTIHLLQTNNLMYLADVLVHEITHLDSFQARYVNSSPDYGDRVGLEWYSDGNLYFNQLNEALTQERANRFLFRGKLSEHPLFREQMRQSHKYQEAHALDFYVDNTEPIPKKRPLFERTHYQAVTMIDDEMIPLGVSYAESRLLTDKLFELLAKLNPDTFADKEQVYQLFIEAQRRGDWHQVGHLIDNTFGVGSLKTLAHASENRESYEIYVMAQVSWENLLQQAPYDGEQLRSQLIAARLTPEYWPLDEQDFSPEQQKVIDQFDEVFGANAFAHVAANTRSPDTFRTSIKAGAYFDKLSSLIAQEANLSPESLRRRMAKNQLSGIFWPPSEDEPWDFDQKLLAKIDQTFGTKISDLCAEGIADMDDLENLVSAVEGSSVARSNYRFIKAISEATGTDFQKVVELVSKENLLPPHFYLGQNSQPGNTPGWRLLQKAFGHSGVAILQSLEKQSFQQDIGPCLRQTVMRLEQLGRPQK